MDLLQHLVEAHNRVEDKADLVIARGENMAETYLILEDGNGAKLLTAGKEECTNVAKASLRAALNEERGDD